MHLQEPVQTCFENTIAAFDSSVNNVPMFSGFEMETETTREGGFPEISKNQRNCIFQYYQFRNENSKISKACV